MPYNFNRVKIWISKPKRKEEDFHKKRFCDKMGNYTQHPKKRMIKTIIWLQYILCKMIKSCSDIGIEVLIVILLLSYYKQNFTYFMVRSTFDSLLSLSMLVYQRDFKMIFLSHSFSMALKSACISNGKVVSL